MGLVNETGVDLGALAERYATPLPKLTDEVETLAARPAGARPAQASQPRDRRVGERLRHASDRAPGARSRARLAPGASWESPPTPSTAGAP